MLGFCVEDVQPSDANVTGQGLFLLGKVIFLQGKVVFLDETTLPSKRMTLPSKKMTLPSEKMTLPSNSSTFKLYMKERFRVLQVPAFGGGGGGVNLGFAACGLADQVGFGRGFLT